MKRHNPLVATRATIANTVSRKANLYPSESRHLIGQILNEIASSLKAGEEVRLVNFGVLYIRTGRRISARNLKDGTPISIEPRRAVVFRPSQRLKLRMNSRDADR
ncbi:HU family DNA-binding protein [Polymorphum gilvum]|uniref:HU family DNA-binding protein n=1 Tax=Polymorphum gilvum TaxID=991904 RepID=UPI000A04F605